MGSKCLALGAGHMCRKQSCQKNVWLSIQTHLRFFNFFSHFQLQTKILIHNYI
jgi:hypothetical protein